MHTPVCSTEDAVMQLFEKHRVPIACALNAEFGNSLLTDEALQDARIAVSRHWREFDREKGLFKSWATGIARNMARARLREAKREQVLLEKAVIEGMLYETEVAVSEGHFERQHVALQECVGLLKPFHRRVIQWWLIDQLDSVNIAALTGRSAGAVRVLVHRLRILLGDCIRHRVPEDDSY